MIIPPIKLNIDYISDVMRTPAKIPNGAHPEMAPSFYTLNGKTYMNITTAYTVLSPFKDGKSVYDFFHSQDVLDFDNRRLVLDSFSGYGASQNGGDWTDEEVYNDKSCWEDAKPYWKRQYSGICGSRVMSIHGKEYIINIIHGENKNERTLDGKCFIILSSHIEI